MRINYIPAVSLLLGALCWPALGAERDFQSVVGAIEARLGVRHTHIPMLGLTKLFIRASAPSGDRQFELATFENISYSPGNMRDFRSAVSHALGDSWLSMVQVQAQGRSQYTGIFLKGHGGRLHMMIATIEAREATVVEIQLSAAQLFDWLRAPERIGHRAMETSRSASCCEEE